MSEKASGPGIPVIPQVIGAVGGVVSGLGGAVENVGKGDLGGAVNELGSGAGKVMDNAQDAVGSIAPPQPGK